MEQDSVIIAVAEDNPVNRKTFVQKASQLSNCTLAFIAQNGNECLEELKGLPVQRLPQVIFMDLEMPELDGIQTITLAKSLYPQIHFIVLTVFDDDEKIFDAIRAGASGYLLKYENSSKLQEAIEQVLRHEGAPMSPPIARKALQLLSRSSREGTDRPDAQLPTILTDREKEILQQMVNGWDAKKIAAALDLSVLTVRKHTANIYSKLHVNSKAQVISLAHRHHWL